MASHNLTGFIILNELANFKGTPKKLVELEERLKEKFPKIGTKNFSRRIQDAVRKSHLKSNPFGLENLLPTEQSYLNQVVN